VEEGFCTLTYYLALPAHDALIVWCVGVRVYEHGQVDGAMGQNHHRYLRAGGLAGVSM